LYDPYESGLPAVSVQLVDAGNNVIATTQTDDLGYYQFSSQAAGTYSVVFAAPGGFYFSPQNVGTDPTRDSDADPATGATATVTLQEGESVSSLDAGLSQSRPTPTLSLSSSANPAVYGQVLTLAVSAGVDETLRGGTVTFFNGGTPLGTV